MTAVYYVTVRLRAAESLTISRILVEGNSQMSRGEVVSLLDGLRGTNMLAADLDAWRHTLLESPWVADATIRRVFPATVAVAITERQPLAIGRIDQHLYLIDRRGVVIDEYGPNYADLDLPIIDGLTVHQSADHMLVDDTRAALAGRLLSALSGRPDLARRVSQIDVSDAHDAVVLLRDDTVLVRVGEEDFVTRLQSYVDMAEALHERVPDIDTVDLRYDERVYVKPQRTGTRTHQGQKGSGG
jgi:cell division protein FtsQ